MKSVAFHGFSPDSLDGLRPYLDAHPKAEVWGFNYAARLGTTYLETGRMSYDRWYEIHAFPKLGEDIPFLKRADCPVFMQQPHPDVPTSAAYPLEDAKRLLAYPYFTNTVTFMVAHAILDGFDEIALFGIDMAVRMGDGPSELSEQRPSVEYALGIATGRGIRIVIPDGSDLLKTNVLYGYEEHVDSVVTRMRRRREGLVKMLDRYQAQCDAIRGALYESEQIEASLLLSETT